MGLFGSKKLAQLTVDIHSHLIPGIDDGSQSLDQSIELIQKLKGFGVKKIITTPHIHPRYPNTSNIILEGLAALQAELTTLGIDIEVEAAAEYYVDEDFAERVSKNDTFLTFGENYILVEAPFQNKPIYFESVMFELKSKGYQPILAHPERYRFLEGNLDWVLNLRDQGILMQVTIGSISGYYGTIPAKLGSQLLKVGAADFLGSDLHRLGHIEHLERGLKSKDVRKALGSGVIKNDSLL